MTDEEVKIVEKARAILEGIGKKPPHRRK